jgi:sugar phosphate permease
MPAGAAVAALTLPHLGARQALVALGAACVAAAAGGAAVVRDAPAVHEPPPDVPWTLRDGRLWTLGISSGLLMMTQVTLLSFAVLFLHDARGVSAAVAAVVLAAVQAVGFVLRIATGVWSDRAGSRVGPFRVVTLAATATLAAAAALADAPLWLLVPALILAGGTSMGWNTLSFTAAAELGGRARAGTAIGFQQTALSVAAAVAGPLFALAVDATSWQAAYAFAALLPLLAFGLLRRLPG